jgi:hypothetical protein
MRWTALHTQSSDFPGAKATMLSELADTEAAHGHFDKALSLSLSAADHDAAAGDKESAASFLAQAAVREAEVGFLTRRDR